MSVLNLLLISLPAEAQEKYHPRSPTPGPWYLNINIEVDVDEEDEDEEEFVSLFRWRTATESSLFFFAQRDSSELFSQSLTSWLTLG